MADGNPKTNFFIELEILANKLKYGQSEVDSIKISQNWLILRVIGSYSQQ